LADLKNLPDYHFPMVAAVQNFTPLKSYIEQAQQAGKYIIAPDPIMIFERLRSLMGFEELMIAPYTQPEGLEDLLDSLTELTIAAIGQYAALGRIDAFMTWDDWGLQTTLQMNIETFRKFYKPRYARIIDAAHQFGMHYIWHNCGYIMDMIQDMIDIGVDVVQLDQPRLMGYEALADAFGGKITFWNTLDIQWSVAEGVTEEDIKTEIGKMVNAFNRFGGGFLARQYPQPGDIALSGERNIAIYDAFLEKGCGLDGIKS